MSVKEKLKTLLEHWASHNRGHAGTYRQWAKRAAEAGFGDVAALLEEAAEMNTAMNTVFEKAAKKLEEV
jgi:rubrerythrin